MAELLMTTPRGERELRRPHTPESSPLRAWSAADQLALDELATSDLGRVLIVNDEFGALTCGLAGTEPTVWGDSALSRGAINTNLLANGFNEVPADRSVPGHHQPEGVFDTIIVRVPKTSALLEHQLRAIRLCCRPDTRVIGTGMARHIHSSTVAAFEKCIGTTVTSRATRKARLIHATATADPPKPSGQGQSSEEAGSFVTRDGITVIELPGTFSAGHVDVGSALLLDVLAEQPAPAGNAVVADLGCGNGVLAVTMASQWTEASFMLLDASDLAIAAAEQTWTANDLGDRATFQAADGFGDMANDSVDVVITNPPFHQGHALDPDMTERLLADTARVLTPEGAAYVVAQRHLNLHTRMQQWFSNVDVISKHPTHVVLAARHRQ